MSDTDVIDGTAQDITADTGPAVVVPYVPPPLAVTPQVKAVELVERLGVIREAMDTAMTADVDYGVIPGTNKPALLKPGAEKLSVLFQLDVQLVNEKAWGPGDHLTVMSRATVYHAPTGQRLGYGEGLCTTKEKKYGKRQQDRSCPDCNAHTIKRSKFPPRNNPRAEPGWYCYAKIGGCGANFSADDTRIVGQPTGEIDNPDLPDLWNTVVKMAEKRARVDAVLAVTGASALFTQDVEDNAPAREPEHVPDEPRDVKRTGASDVPAEDAWFESIRPLLKGVPGAGLRAAVIAAGGEVPARVGSWQRVICALDAGQRKAFVSGLEQLADVPWTEPAGTTA